MISRQPLPETYVAWNEKWGAPDGRPEALMVSVGMRMSKPQDAYGPFAYQVSSGTRTFEYPWAYFSAGEGKGLRLLDVGGGTAGLQFVYAMEGFQVTNVDPMEEGNAGAPVAMPWWQMMPDLHDKINEAFGTDVRLIRKRLQEADLDDESFDRVVCLSVIEHLSPADARTMLEHIVRVLAPGGLLIATVDLFFDLKPFGVLDRNGYGTNIDIARLLDGLGLDMVSGDRRELFGYPEFDRDRLVEILPELYMSPSYPLVSQAMILRKPE
jgi:2-polyprenyl-3-methyl-5-hydroxy-6-metoxy-1,4-benzoquinol methylase